MDSYYSRDTARSPGDRTWSGRDDRGRDDRHDSFLRARSPGASLFVFASVMQLEYLGFLPLTLLTSVPNPPRY